MAGDAWLRCPLRSARVLSRAYPSVAFSWHSTSLACIGYSGDDRRQSELTPLLVATEFSVFNALAKLTHECAVIVS